MLATKKNTYRLGTMPSLKVLNSFVFKTFVFLAIKIMLLQEAHAIPSQGVDFVTDFISDPKVSSYKENYINLSVKSQLPMTTFTYCFRIKLYSIIMQCLFEESKIGFKFQTKSYGFVTFHEAWIMFEYKQPLVPMKWYHICMSYVSGHILLVMNNQTLIDEKPIKQLENLKVTMNPVFTLGLCKDSEYKDYPLKGITRGRVADFNFWSVTFSKNTLLDFTNKCMPIVDEADIINWDGIEKAARGNNAKIIQLQKQDLCGTKRDADQDKSIVVLPFLQTYHSAKRLCNNLGGKLPLASRLEDVENWNDTISLVNRFDKEENNVMDGICRNTFWVPIVQGGRNNTDGDFTWIEDNTKERNTVTFLPWEFSQPNGLEFQPCVSISLTTKQIGDYSCNDESFCSLCEFSGSVNFHFHGLPETSTMDHSYIFLPELQTGSQLIFIGHGKNKISWTYEMSNKISSG